VLDGTTYYFTAFALDTDDTIIDVQSNSIKTDFWPLPKTYKQVEYIQSSWRQYIDTNIQLWTNTFKVDCDFAIASWSSYEQAVFSIWTSSYNYWNVFIRQTKYIDAYLSAHNEIYNTLSLDTKYKATFERTSSSSWKLWLDNNSTNINYSPWTTNNTTLKLFMRWDTPWTTESDSRLKMYWCKIYLWWTLIRELIPCYRKADTIIWMYDVVNDVFYTNAWSWTFTKWPDL